MSTLDARLNAYREDLADARLQGKVEAARFVPGTRRQVVLGALPLRKAATPGTELVSELLFGETVQVFEDKDGVAWVQNDTDGYVGYTDSAGLSETVHAPTHTVCVLHASLYPEPHVRVPVADNLPMGARLAVTETEGRFAGLAGGGWVPEEHFVEDGEIEADFVTVAEQFTGVPYVWGGRTSRGLDCSGLVQIALARCGVAAPRDSDMMETTLGEPVAYDGDESVLRRGDLVFWKGHMGIWIAPDRFLHANWTDMRVWTSRFQQVVDHIQKTEGLPVSAVRRL